MEKYEKGCIYGELSHFAAQQKLMCVLCVLSCFSRVGLCDFMTEAHKAPLSMGNTTL